MAENECNVDDILCKLDVLKGLRTIEGALGKESFSEKFPELQGLGDKIKESINNSQSDLREALAKCGNDDLLKETIEGLDDIINVTPESVNAVEAEVVEDGS